MAQKYYTSQETAQLLGISEEEVRAMLDRRELHGYRDGASWKFRAEDIDKLVKERPQAAPTGEEETGDVLLSEVELGQSDPGTSGTVIGMGRPLGESDLLLAASDIKLVDEPRTPEAKAKDASKSGQFEELELGIDDELALDGSSPSMKTDSQATPTGSALELSDKVLDDDLVLGGSKGSDLSLGGDSGISLIDPADSGLSLEQPLELAGGSKKSLEVGEDDLLLAGEADEQAGVKTDDDFLLTPLDEGGDAEDSESGSQVIALETEGDEAAVGAVAGGGMAAMLDEDLTAQPALDLGMGAPMIGGTMLGGQAGGLPEGAAAIPASAVLPEVPYTGWQIAGLASCVVLLMLCGMMMYDTLRNMWSWDQAYTINSSIMDTILGWIGW
jgi:excisionase family DNA binding protein